ncbi:hypothetical protein B7R21_11840 [Subtercola boreus]|uniref:Uncharacterized protein n=1 Tax=Subtercola boreus TaxID=120213 RepID=A0A3E0VQ54_9MICO|nr:hypothetical protein B7R21_11840 [Subtercola boreus]
MPLSDAGAEVDGTEVDGAGVLGAVVDGAVLVAVGVGEAVGEAVDVVGASVVGAGVATKVGSAALTWSPSTEGPLSANATSARSARTKTIRPAMIHGVLPRER